MTMQPNQQSHETTSIVRLGWGATTIVLGVHLVFAALRGLLNLWVALTPSQDSQWNLSHLRA